MAAILPGNARNSSKTRIGELLFIYRDDLGSKDKNANSVTINKRQVQATVTSNPDQAPSHPKGHSLPEGQESQS